MTRKPWWTWEYGIMLSIMLMVPGFVALNQIPPPLQQARTTFAVSSARVRSLYPGSQILTAVPDMYNDTLAYRYRVRTPDGRLWHLYVDVNTGRVIARKPIHVSSSNSPPNTPISMRTKAIEMARQAVGGGQIATVRTITEDNGRTYVVELMLTNGQYAKIHVDPKESKILTVHLEKVDR